MPLDPDIFLERLLRNLEAGMASLAEAVEKGTVSIDDNGTIHLPKLEALPDDGPPKRTLELMFKEIGDVQFPDLMLEVDAHTNEWVMGKVQLRCSLKPTLISVKAARHPDC